jgi:hypothetical protein
MKKQNVKSVSKGVAIAIAAAGLLSGCQSLSASSPQQASTDLVHCYGVNACKGHNDCKTASNACAGHASCKGHGFVAMPSKACGDVGGKTQDSWKGTVARADLIHCTGVNACKGHNDCKTASNACAGHASCKGHGFVSMPAKACGDIGGKKG